MTTTARTTTRALFMTLLALGATACGDDGTGPEAGEMEMTVRDDPGTTQASAIRAAAVRAVRADPSLVVGGRDAVASAVESGRFAALASSYQGVITADANGYVSTDGDTWIELGSPASASIELQSSGETTIHSSTAIQGGRYTRARLVLRNARATLRAGSVIGGLTLSADVVLTLGGSDSEVVIEKQVSTFEVRSDARATVAWEMNSEAWSNEENAEDEEVEDEEVQQAAEADARSESSDRTARASTFTREPVG